MAIKKFENLLVWQKYQDFAVSIYKDFSTLEDYSFKDKNQITRASVFISNNIAKGLDRRTNPDFIRFLHIAISSNSEVRPMLYLSERLGYLSSDKTKALIERSNEIKMLYGPIKSMT